jgi:hypothetical protein
MFGLVEPAPAELALSESLESLVEGVLEVELALELSTPP